MCDKFQQGFLDQNLHTPFVKGVDLRGTPQALCHIQSSELNQQGSQRYERCRAENDINCLKTLQKAYASSEKRLMQCLALTKNE